MKVIEASSSNFELIRKTDKLYVDKTEYIYNMIMSSQMVFFARPRRFGKSMTVSTMKAIFEGKRDLFKGLAIDSKPYDWKTYPIIHIDFGSCAKKNATDLEEWLCMKVLDFAKMYKIRLSKKMGTSEVLFEKLICSLSMKMGNVVILIDEYDKVLSDNILSDKIEELRETLGNFYQVIKTHDDKIHFAFITGVTKYSKLSVFSKMNNLSDYSMTKDFACMFGYTQTELEHYFADYIDEALKNVGRTREDYLAELKVQYDGYCFYPGAETVYNPVSIGCFFDDGGTRFSNYWIDTGNTSLLMNIAKKINFNVLKDVSESVLVSDLGTFDITLLAKNPTKDMLKSLLLQTGYLTIKRTNTSGSLLYLDFPNREVQTSFCSNILTAYYSTKEHNVPRLCEDAKDAFEIGDVEAAINKLKSVFALSKSTEAYYHILFFIILRFYGADINAEESNSGGRADAVLKVGNHIYVIEFKKGLSADVAIKQIEDKHYADKYILDPMGKTIHLLGITFGEKERNIVDYLDKVVIQ